jgi:thiamine biosynthesis protein ThiS
MSKLKIIFINHPREQPAMKLTVNGKELNLENVSTLRELLEHLDIKAGRVVVERNESEIISRSDFEKTRLHEGDRLEILNFVGGGTC